MYVISGLDDVASVDGVGSVASWAFVAAGAVLWVVGVFVVVASYDDYVAVRHADGVAVVDWLWLDSDDFFLDLGLSSGDSDLELEAGDAAGWVRDAAGWDAPGYFESFASWSVVLLYRGWCN